MLDYLIAQNAILDPPLDFNEVKGIAKSIQKYWERHGGVHTVEWLEKQQRRGRKSGKARRAAEAPRDREIRLLNYAEWSVREIAQELNIPKSVVHYVVARDPWVQLPFEALDTVPPPPSLMRMTRAGTGDHDPAPPAGPISIRQIEAQTGFKRDTIHRVVSKKFRPQLEGVRKVSNEPIKMMSVGPPPDPCFCLESARSAHSQSEEFGGGKISPENSSPPSGPPNPQPGGGRPKSGRFANQGPGQIRGARGYVRFDGDGPLRLVDEFGQETVAANVDLAEQTPGIHNPGGWLRTACREQWAGRRHAQAPTERLGVAQEGGHRWSVCQSGPGQPP